MNLVFKALDEAHLEWSRSLHNDPDVLLMLTDPRVVTPREQEIWFSKLQKSNSSQRLLVFDENSFPIGLIRLDSIDRSNKSVCVGLDIHRNFRGKGCAKPIYYKLFKSLFLEEKFNRVWLMVAEYNTVARNLYKQLGFTQEGVQRQALYKDGFSYDYIMMSILKGEYNEKYPSI